MLKTLLACGVLTAVLGGASALGSEQVDDAATVRGAGGVEIPVIRYPARGDTLFLWLPSVAGITAGDQRVGKALARKGYEVWLADLHDARFLPTVASSMDKIPPEDVARLLTAAGKTGKRICLVAGDRGAALALAGASLWRKSGGENTGRLAGAILLSPNFYAAPPDPGKEPQWTPAADRNRLPVAILQPAFSPYYWRVEDLKQRLAREGAPVSVRILKGVRDRFYFRDDASPPETAAGAQLAQWMERDCKKLGDLLR